MVLPPLLRPTDAASDEDWDDDGDDGGVDGPLDGGTHVERDPDDPRAVPPSDADFEFARASAVPNVGEDIKASARHRWRWADLTTAEADGAAAGDGGT